MKTQLKLLTYNQSFIYNGNKYTCKQQGIGMVELYCNHKLHAWPHYNGKNIIEVEICNP
jgi:hypothetical protein